MSGPVKKSDLAAVSHFGRIAALREKFLDRFVNFHPIHTRLDSFQGQRLSGFHCLPKFSLPIARPSAHNRPSDVAKISRSHVARENIENDQRTRVKRAGAAFMRIACLIGAGNDRARRISARAQDRGINFRAQHFRGQRFAIPAQSFSSASFRRFQNFDGALQPGFGNSQRAPDHFDFLLGFCFALRPEKSVRRAEPDFVCG